MLIEITGPQTSKAVKTLDEEFLQSSLRECTLEARGRNINVLVDLALEYTGLYKDKVRIKNISIGTGKKIRVSGDRAKNVSWMNIILEKV